MAATAHLLQSEKSSDKMDPATATLPLSPTASPNGGRLPQGFEDLVQHITTNNTATSYPREQVKSEASNTHSSPEQLESRMSTPATNAAMSPHFAEYGLSTQQPQQPSYANGFTYPSQAAYDLQDDAYPSLPDEQPAYTTPTSSPPQRSDIIGLRNGAVPRPATTPRPLASKGRIQKAPKKRKGRERSDKDKVVLEKPLSEMGVEWKHSMDEIAVYVNRSAEERKNETDSDRKQPGRVKRPMNSFMLYRKAFQNHTKAYCEHNNHQVVSKVCGASWDMEPENIRNQFAEWAKQERANHQQAHPGYKFAPAKPNKATKRKNESDDEASDLESYDWESGQRIRRPRSRTGTPMPDHHKLYEMPYYHPPQQPLPQYGQPQAMTNSHNAVLSSYGYTNPHKQMPSPYTSIVLGGQTGQYLSSNSVANQSYGQRGYVEDVSYHKAPSPGTPYHHPMQPALLDSYVSTPQQHTPPAAQIMDGRADAGMYTSMDAMFDPNKPMRLRDHGIDTSGPFDVNFGGNALGDQFDDRHDYLHRFVNDLGGEQLFQDQQAQQLLRGNDESWDIQPLNEAQAGEGYDDWDDVDPSLSQPYELNDPSLSEVYPARD